MAAAFSQMPLPKTCLKHENSKNQFLSNA